MQRPQIERVFRLSLGKVFCDGGGLSIGGVALLERSPAGGQRGNWRVRQTTALDRELSEAYGHPIDIEAKIGGLELVARCLAGGEIAKAQIATLLLRLPSPLPLNKEFRSPSERDELAIELAESGLLKGDWDPSKHPRTGAPPNRAWFANTPREHKPAKPGSRWPSATVNRAARDWIVQGVESAAEDGSLLVDGLPLAEAIAIFIDGLGLGSAGEGEDRITQQLFANYIRPKTLEELQTPPVDFPLGYERHHIVEQNPANIEKDCVFPVELVSKFGQELIDDPSNLVWIPRLKHEQITALYNGNIANDPIALTFRQVVNQMDFEDQRAVGLAIMRETGILR